MVFSHPSVAFLTRDAEPELNLPLFVSYPLSKKEQIGGSRGASHTTTAHSLYSYASVIPPSKKKKAGGRAVHINQCCIHCRLSLLSGNTEKYRSHWGDSAVLYMPSAFLRPPVSAFVPFANSISGTSGTSGVSSIRQLSASRVSQ